MPLGQNSDLHTAQLSHFKQDTLDLEKPPQLLITIPDVGSHARVRDQNTCMYSYHAVVQVSWLTPSVVPKIRSQIYHVPVHHHSSSFRHDFPADILLDAGTAFMATLLVSTWMVEAEAAEVGKGLRKGGSQEGLRLE